MTFGMREVGYCVFGILWDDVGVVIFWDGIL